MRLRAGKRRNDHTCDRLLVRCYALHQLSALQHVPDADVCAARRHQQGSCTAGDSHTHVSHLSASTAFGPPGCLCKPHCQTPVGKKATDSMGAPWLTLSRQRRWRASQSLQTWSYLRCRHSTRQSVVCGSAIGHAAKSRGALACTCITPTRLWPTLRC